MDASQITAGFRYLRSCTRGGNIPLRKILRIFCEKIDFIHADAPDLDVRQINLNGIVKILDDFDEIYGDWQISARINEMTKFLERQAAEEYKYHNFFPRNPDVDAVQIMTVHKAKGLEFHTVFLPDLENGEFPVVQYGGKKYWHVLGGRFEEQKEKYASDLEDERKLFYVAVTRAKQNLYLSYQLSSKALSPFVAEAAESNYLMIDRMDLKTMSAKAAHDPDAETDTSMNGNDTQENSREYWAAVKAARHALYDYYGTGAHFHPAMYTEIERIKNMSPDEILRETRQCGLM